MAETRMEAVMRENAAELERRAQARLGVQPAPLIGKPIELCISAIDDIARSPRVGWQRTRANES